MTDDISKQPQRYSALGPLEIGLEVIIVVDICNFFHPSTSAENRKILGLPASSAITAFSVLQFFQWAQKQRKNLYDVHRFRQHIFSLISRMTQIGFLTFEGHSSQGAMGFAQMYCFNRERSNKELRGLLWLGKVLGPGFIGFQIKPALVRITGKKLGDPAIGTGTHVLPNFVVTCAHVIEDMTIDDMLLVNSCAATVTSKFVSKNADVGVIEISPPIPCHLPDLAYRDANLLEGIVIAGFPTIPTAITNSPTFQTGEICQTNVQTYWKKTIDLFSAIARPGNSGGPVFSLTGNIVGMVTQSLERDQELVDPMRPLPFFASVPASVIQREFAELTGQEIPWEDYT